MYLCEVIGQSAWLGSTNDSLTPEDELMIGQHTKSRDHPVYVAVKTLNNDADELTRYYQRQYLILHVHVHLEKLQIIIIRFYSSFYFFIFEQLV